MSAVQLRVEAKADYQKDDCLFCDEKATLQVVAWLDAHRAFIRFCGAKECRAKAKKVARVSVRAWGKAK